jgi:hypothetical protein
MTDYTRCWQRYDVRPPGSSSNPERTKPEFRRWDAAFERDHYIIMECRASTWPGTGH